ncbi:O-antigen ligase family protein [Phenylobacterium soli]|uniref:O-antigen ligase family protein n=1 Tax=Phenylobacterium soli TaxID=2170551 RepID=UPI0010580CE2|nr:O-antigen ligase family protein [Phenylobacterium soli]
MTIPAAEGVAEARAPAHRHHAGVFLWPLPAGGWIAVAGVALLYGAHWLYGAQSTPWVMLLNIGAALLVGALLLAPRVRAELARLRGLAVPAALFAATVAIALLTLTPWVPGGPHPVWAFVGQAPGASTVDKSSTAVEIVRLLGLACLFVIGLATGARDERARYAVRLTLAAGVAFGLWAFFGAVTGQIYQSQGRRLEAHFLSPNTAATLFGMLLTLAVAEALMTLRTRGGRRDPVRLAAPSLAILVFATCLLDTASRGGALAFLGAMAVFLGLQLWTGRLRLTRGVLAGLGGLAVVAVLILLAGERLLDRVFQSHEAALVRTSMWRAHWSAFLDSPLLGYGLGAFDTVNKLIMDAGNLDALWDIHSVHNVYLQWLEEAGILGSAPMFACLGALMLLTLRGLLRRSRMTALLSALLAADVLVLLHGTTDVGLQVPSLAGFWAWLLGLQVSLAQGSSRR